MTQPHFVLDLVYNSVFKFGFEKINGATSEDSQTKDLSWGRSCSHPIRDTILQELTFAR
jgi:hypothetical protein